MGLVEVVQGLVAACLAVQGGSRSSRCALSVLMANWRQSRPVEGGGGEGQGFRKPGSDLPRLVSSVHLGCSSTHSISQAKDLASQLWQQTYGCGLRSNRIHERLSRCSLEDRQAQDR